MALTTWLADTERGATLARRGPSLARARRGWSQLRLRALRPHGRPWSGAFNVVMATGIVSIAVKSAGLEWVSVVLLWATVLAFAPLAVLDVVRARHPVSLLRRAGDPRHGFPALGFVAATCVLGTRIAHVSSVTGYLAVVLLGCGGVVWIAIAIAELRTRAGGRAINARGEWLLAVVATEALAILAARLDSAGYPALRVPAVALWGFGIAVYLVISSLIAVRLRRRPLRPGQLTPDWWILMGAPAIVAVAAACVHSIAGEAATLVVAIGWVIATAWIPVLMAAELWQARATGAPHITPARWTMVFPLGMYSSMSQMGGHLLGLSWMSGLGRWWVGVALAAWCAVTIGELHLALRPRAAEYG